MIKILYSNSITDRLLSCYIQNPSLCLDSKYPIDKKEFQVKFHEILYVTIYNLAQGGCKTITIFDINEWLRPYEAQYNTYLDNNGDDYVLTITDLVNGSDNFDYYYTQFRKFSCLQYYKDNGFNVDKFYDETKSEESQLENLNQYDIETIVQYYDGIQANAKENFIKDANVEDYKAGADFEYTKDSLKESPLIGASFQSPYLNAIYNGLYGFIFRSGKSGGGKTVATCGDICKVSVTHYWDDEVGDFVENKSFEGAGLIISTEMDLRKELDPILVAWIANVDRKFIRRNQYPSKEIEERVDRAGKILADSPLYTVDMPDFTIEGLSRKIEDYVVGKGVKNVAFDYCQTQPFVNREIAKELNIPPREDLVLLTMTDRLKNLQRKLDINLLSGSQLNGTEDNMSYPTECCLAGGKSQIRKLDGAMIMLPPSKKELEAIGMVDKRVGFGLPTCNRITHIIKGRANEYEDHLKLCSYLDLGTGRQYDLCVLDKNNKPYKVEPLSIESV